MDWLRDWIMAVTCAAMALALLEGLVPDGAGKKACHLAGGLALLLVAVGPVAKLDVGKLTGALADYRGELDSYEQALAEESEERYKTIIAERTAAYIVDKAAELGVSCQAEVTIGYDDNGTLCPWAVTARGDWTAAQREALSRALEEELGVPAARQYFGESSP